MGTKWSAFPDAAPLDAGDDIVGLQSGDNVKFSPAQIATFLGSTFQPLDSDLTAIAALTTTSFGRSLLTQADASAARATIGVGRSIPSGRFLIPENAGSGIAAGATFPTNFQRCFIGFIREPITIASLAVRLTVAAAAGNFQLAIYAIDPATMLPTGPPLYSSASQTTAAIATVTVAGVGLALPAGYYGFCINHDANAATAVYQSFLTSSFSQTALLGAATAATALAAFTGIYRVQTFNTWPTLTGVWATDGWADYTNQPVIAYSR